MTVSRIEGESYFQLDIFFYNEQVSKVINHILPKFIRVIKNYVLFNILFLCAFVLEIVILSAFFSLLVQSTLLAFGLALIFLTGFSYFILRLYFQTKKPEQLKKLRNSFLKSCKHLLNYKEGIPEHYLAIANACCKFSSVLNNKEYHVYHVPRWFKYLIPYVERFSCWWHWQDMHHMKELLLLSSVEEHIKLVKCEPTSLEVHAALANAYVMLSGLYSDPRKNEGYDDDRWIPSGKFTDDMDQKFRATAERAIEEFKILNDFAPNDTWVHSQLAYSYHDLKMPHEEIREYETIIKLRPNDRESLYKLGVLYFQQGMNAQGLSIYEELKRANFKKAEQLINFYGTYRT